MNNQGKDKANGDNDDLIENTLVTVIGRRHFSYFLILFILACLHASHGPPPRDMGMGDMGAPIMFLFMFVCTLCLRHNCMFYRKQ